MDLSGLWQNLVNCIKKYRYVILVLLVGIVLMCWPGGSSRTDAEATQPTVAQEEMQFLCEEELEAILSKISGAGEVKVLLSYACGPETVYHQDEDTTANEAGTVIKKETVILNGADRAENAMVRVVLSPVYQGAIILSKGGDQPAVKLAIVEAVSKATGLGVDDICVLKMK